MNRAEMRDWVRRMLGIIPPVDTTDADAQPGQAPIHQPYPTNALINQCIANAAALVNAKLGIAVDSTIVSCDVEGQTVRGPYRLDLAQFGGEYNASIYAVREVWWHNGTYDTLLEPASFEDLNRRGEPWSDVAPSVPRYIITEGLNMYLVPAPASRGKVKARFQRGICAPLSDHEGFQNLPAEFETHLLFTVLVEIASTISGDTEMAQRLVAFRERAALGLDAIARWVSTTNMRYQPSIIAKPYR